MGTQHRSQSTEQTPDGNRQPRCIILGAKPEGRSNLSEALTRVGHQACTLAADPSAALLEFADIVLVDGDSYGDQLAWVVESALATAQIPILIVGGSGEFVQGDSPRVFVAPSADASGEINTVLNDILKHLVARS